MQCFDESKTPSQYLTVYSKTDGNPQIVRAIYRPAVSHNLIARRIVQRLELRRTDAPSIPERLLCGQNRLELTGQYVDLACFTTGSDDSIIHRFYVVKSCTHFDILFGFSVVDSVDR